MKLAEFFTKARASLDKNGWCQYTYYDGKGRMCLWGAIISANEIGVAGVELVGRSNLKHLKLIDDVICTALKGCGAGAGLGPFAWNDTPGRTVEEVKTLLDECAILSGEREAVDE